jgi:predicted nucleic acid-binding protein
VLHTENLANQNEIERRIVLWQANNCRQSMLPHLDIDMLANQIRTLSSISGYDAEHIACAEVGGCDYLLTGDDRLLTRFNRLKVSGALALNVVLQNPVDFLMSLPEEENGDER